MKSTLMTLDLNGVTSSQRDKFYEALFDKNWHKIDSVTTGWRKYFFDADNIEDEIKEAIAFACQKSGVARTKVDACAQAGDDSLMYF